MYGKIRLPSRIEMLNNGGSPTPAEGMACAACNLMVMVLPVSNRVQYHYCGKRLGPLTPGEKERLAEEIRKVKSQERCRQMSLRT